MNDQTGEMHVGLKWTTCLAAPVIWALHLFVMYAGHTVTCARVAADSGGRLWPILAASSTLFALGALAATLGLSSRRDTSAQAHAPQWVDRDEFLRDVASALVALSFLGVLWTTLTVALIPACEPQG